MLIILPIKPKSGKNTAHLSSVIRYRYHSLNRYHDLGEDVTIEGGFAHLHCKFDEALKTRLKLKNKGVPMKKNVTAGDRYKERLEQTKPVLDTMK